jgi:hypothetical protein
MECDWSSDVCSSDLWMDTENDNVLKVSIASTVKPFGEPE